MEERMLSHGMIIKNSHKSESIRHSTDRELCQPHRQGFRLHAQYPERRRQPDLQRIPCGPQKRICADQEENLAMGKGGMDMNTTCVSCGHAINCINGKFCTLVHKYIEYCDEPVCETDALFESMSSNVKTSIGQQIISPDAI